MSEKVDVFFTPTYAKVCSNKSGDVISLYLSNATRTAVEIQSKVKDGKVTTLKIKARAKSTESTSLNQFVGLEDPALPTIIKFCLQKRLLTQAEVDLLPALEDEEED